MSELSYLEKLLDGAEVEWLPLSSLCNLITTGKLNANAMEDNGAYPFFTCNEEPYRINTYAFDLEAILISGNGSQVGHLNYYNGKFNAYQRTYILGGFNENVDIMYLYYYLMHTLKPYIHKNSRKGSVPYITMPMLENFKFPIPCPNNLEKSLAIQSEIVRILDKFTALTAELTAELNMRKKQYNYYRDQLLSFKEGEVEWKSLEDIALFRRGSFPQPYGNSEWYDGEGCMPFVQVADVADSGFTLHTKTKQQISKIAQSKSVFVEAGTIVVTLQGTIGRVAITQYDCYVDRTLAIFTNFKVKINKKYFAYQLKAKFDSEKEFARGSTLKTITKEEFSKFQLPLPSINEQNRIVSLLDKFDTLAHSIKQGLPREIELRQKQYEYYRDLLFSFPKPETVSN
ncbi:restriction endonuclease subunit S [Escherichia coli]|uniref:restriction endonuclease subunit S n=1 Tax=Escherichia coli TaxID=562 RepID=UPI000B7D93F7|nr:restriction endonuclease subunit S [Escherichia coli]EHM2893390.1 restriction endonuclease subunit S [Escherichia coli]EHM2965477.1 restriction endonuclease subunit S [Escherichia coli]EHM2979431.1 restriction endonuclease subunit S [Escherichia coli]EHM2997328.1 restriction endonuclease subunit S [Escherichia coli]EHM3184834.1 restriction endonuclease subunit S [Escherichia coli]